VKKKMTPITPESPPRREAEVARGEFVAIIRRSFEDDSHEVAIIQDPPNAWIFEVGEVRGSLGEAVTFALGAIETLIVLKEWARRGHGLPFRLDEKEV
jgi:hypothetical protein